MREKTGASGRLTIRVTPQFHEKLARAAESEGVSLNTLANCWLAEALGRLSVERRLKKVEKGAS